MRTRALACAFALIAAGAAGQVPTPEAHFGFRMGADGRLAAAGPIGNYVAAVAEASDRVVATDLGPTTGGNPTPAAIISSPVNIRNLDAIQGVNRQLADPRLIEPDEARALSSRHKAVVIIGASIHASEIGPSQAAVELLHWLATSEDPRVLQTLEQTIVILIPMLNPDGHRLVVEWQERYRGTPYEDGPMPWLDHPVAGHDINRDAFMMNLAESRNLARFFYTQWHPQVFLSLHQMGTDGPRFFVPPVNDPINRNYDPRIWRTATLLGSAMAFELQRSGRSGVISGALFDYYSPGYEDTAPLGHNVVCLLAEVASAKLASPITIAPSERRAGSRGFSSHDPTMNYPDPWPGGTWTLRDIVEYDVDAVKGLLYAVAAFRGDIVQTFYDIGRDAVETGARGAPFAYIVPQEQFDARAAARLEALLTRSGVEVHRALEPFRADGEPYPAGTDVIFMAQPFRAYVQTLFERQQYPAETNGQGHPARPYDVTGWTLPLQMGVDVVTIERYFEAPPMSRVTEPAVAAGTIWGERRPGYYVIDGRGTAGAIAANRLAAAGVAPSWITAPLSAGGYSYPAGSFVVPHTRESEATVAALARELGLRVDGVRGRAPASVQPIARARVGLHRPTAASIDEGWTRWVLSQHEFPVASVTDAEFRAGNLRATFDAIILPSVTADALVNGPDTALPPEHVAGWGQSGLQALAEFVDTGGTLICLDRSCDAVIEALKLPVRNVAATSDAVFFCPGSLLRLVADGNDPLAYGMRPETAAYFSFSSAYEAPAPARVAARYAQSDLLLSGWLEGDATIAGRAAAMSVPFGKGTVVLLGFRVQHRGQSLATFRLLFNAILAAPGPPVR